MDVSDINRPRFVQSPKFPKPPHPYVYGGVQNSQGDVVICTDYGVAFWKKIDSQNYNSINYYREDGLPHDECNSGALSIDRYDRAWIGTIGGAAVFNPESFSQASAALSLERLQINRVNQNLQASKLHYTTDGTNANIDIEVALFTGVRESESSYRTHLVGLESSPGPWLHSNVRSFTNLPSGHYVLKIEAKDFAGRHAKPIQIELSIPTPWWQSWWAKVFIGLSVVCTLVLFIRLRERQLRMREKQLITLVDQRTGQLERRGKELHSMNEELRRLSYRDTLTGIANRRKLLEILDSTWHDAQLSRTSMAFILLDADDFKAINDNYGHIRGDECLQLIAHQLGLSLSEVECTLGRYGGEEFGIVLPNCTLEQATEIAAKCRMDIEQQQWLHAYSTFGIVTVSLGVACNCPKVGETSETLIAKADAALYLAKQKGKNRVELAVQVIESNTAS
jgi:diguanylate cyclase (GGDEF)-like protein